MKKLYSFLATIFAVVAFYSQALLTIEQTPANSGIYTITYNDSPNGWVFYNPGVGNPIGVYLWLNGADNSTGISFNDNFSNITTQLTWDGTNYSGTVNLNTHNFNNMGGVLPAGTTVNELHFLFTEFPVGKNTHQTTDKLASTYGFTTTVTSSLGTIDINSSKFKSFVSEGRLYTPKKGNVNIQVMDFSGRVIKTFTANSTVNGIELNLPKKGDYILKLDNEIVKFKY
jgi:hypothetical protein